MPRHTIAVTLTEEERNTLDRWVAAYRTPQQLALRCQIVLAAAKGQAGQEDRGLSEHKPANGGPVAQALLRARFGLFVENCPRPWT